MNIQIKPVASSIIAESKGVTLTITPQAEIKTDYDPMKDVYERKGWKRKPSWRNAYEFTKLSD